MIVLFPPRRALSLALSFCLCFAPVAQSQPIPDPPAQPSVQTGVSDPIPPDLPAFVAPKPDEVALPTAAASAEEPGAGAQTAQKITALPHDLSPQGMFHAAHPVVQAVMILLALASFLTWTVLLFKGFELTFARRRLLASALAIRSGSALPAVTTALTHRRDPAAFMAQAAFEEMQISDAALDAAGIGGVKERVHSIVERIEAQAGRRLRRGTGILATIGSTAPFVGLFGTVWGIMNAFIRIAETKSTNLAVVAPGIAEALLATAIGLVAAIPAVVIYNHFARSIASYRLTLGDAGAGVERLVSRDLDFRMLRGE